MTGQQGATTRERLIDATVSLMRAKGAAASGTKEILDLAAAPRGSFYFHFPEGKDQLVRTALERAAAATLLSLELALSDDEGDLGDQVTTIFEAIEADLVSNGYAAGCAVAVTTAESAWSSPYFQEAVSAAFLTWTSALTSRLVRRGLSAQRAAALSDAIVSAMEGATVLARAHRSPTPLRNAASVLTLAINALVAEVAGRGSNPQPAE